ncbi:Ribosomal RNA small subunit methyltransferase B [Defluviimonas aquaemixtae]|uniref:Ribosomal RNA small subunit methyltransferase B n=1 Tax=Albidovulum aquaemixtae TaxID=1542388 RepID=A0A2R8B5C6_9RHOB|nr:RsmB/NOP family class I SAM-dependent RNA methyltransferase [Defluviimonas aquaemixtae]SPH17762.1 Ribosomal RNA small subunit methyltransferase B [Defluviimonas aquaemixtae]
MTPAGRIAASIGLLDRILTGEAAEHALTGWARANRYAGSGDRAAVRDHVYDALRRLRSLTALSGANTPSGRALLTGHLRAMGRNPEEMFTGEGYAPDPLNAAERVKLRAAPGADMLPELVALDCPDWLGPQLKDSLGNDFAPVLEAMRHRAPVFLRVNARRGSRNEVAVRIAEEGIETRTTPLASHALEVTAGERSIRNSVSYQQGFVELQDASPQAAVEALPLKRGMRILDYCAGGGGKSLAIAARADCDVTAHDAEPRRMRDLPVRAARAGAAVRIAKSDLQGQNYDLVLLDVPCSGIGTWRRDPDAKWKLTPEWLSDLLRVQEEILDQGSRLVAPAGTLAYMTCSLLGAENGGQIAAFLDRHPDWRLVEERSFTPLNGGDGFYSAHLTRV